METDPENQEDGVPERQNSPRPIRLPPGFSFNPKDEDLIVCYLNPKIMGEPLPWHGFNDINLYDQSPEELAETFDFSKGERLYFFTPRSRKYPNGSRPARAAGDGYWKATGSEKKIFTGNQLLGVKRTLVYYKGKAKTSDGEKTDWTMQEYISKLTNSSIREPGDSMKLDDWVLCTIHKKRGAIDDPNKLLEASEAQSDMPDNDGSYQTFIDQNADYSNAIMAQPLAASPSGLMTNFNGMVQPLAGAPSEQMIHSNALAVGYGEPMANFSCTSQKPAISPAPSEQMIDYNRMMQPRAVGYGEPMANFSCTAQKTAISPAPSEQMIDYHRMMQPSAADYGEPMANFSCTAQNTAISPAEPMTYFNGMAQPFAAAPIAQMTGFNDMEPSMSATFHRGMPRMLAGVVPDESIVDFSAMRQPSSWSPNMELNGAMSINNNYSTRQGFQHNLSHEMPRFQHLVGTFGMAFDETDEVTAPWSTYPSMEGPSNQKS